MDLTKLQIQIILLIKKYLNNSKNYNILKNKEHELQIGKKLLTSNISELSNYLMMKKSDVIKNINRNLSGPKNQKISKQSKADLKKSIKSLAVYELYKFLNFEKLAGQIRQENFAYNMIIGGSERAKHYAGNTAHKVALHSATFLKKLANAY